MARRLAFRKITKCFIKSNLPSCAGRRLTVALDWGPPGRWMTAQPVNQ